MTRTARQDGVSLRRLVTLGLVALGLAVATVARMGVTEALAFDPAATPVGVVVPAHTTGGEIVCSAGTVAIAANTLWIDNPSSYPAMPQYNITYVRYYVWLYRWNGTGWVNIQSAGDLEDARTPWNKQIPFSGLKSGFYTLTLRIEFDDDLWRSIGWSDWRPNATDFYYASKNYYCTI